MALVELPHTSGCVVCGHDNPFGLHLRLFVDEQTGIVTCPFEPAARHIGFEGIVHGGVIATVLDEAMVWAATWAGKRFCVCGELNVRFRESVILGGPLQVVAKVIAHRSRLITTEGTLADDQGRILVSASGKYVPVSSERNVNVVSTLVTEPATSQTMQVLKQAAGLS